MLERTVCPFDFLSIPISHSADEGSSGSIDLSKATGLKDAALTTTEVSNGFRLRYAGTVISNTTMQNPTNLRRVIGKNISQGWLELDDALVQESHSIRSELVSVVLMEGKVEGGCWVGSLLPEATARGIIRLVEQYSER